MQKKVKTIKAACSKKKNPPGEGESPLKIFGFFESLRKGGRPGGPADLPGVKIPKPG